LAACKKFCLERGWTIVAIYSDAGASGWEFVDRPEFNNMMEFIRVDRDVNMVFYDYSRFFRDTRRALNEFDKLDAARNLYDFGVQSDDRLPESSWTHRAS
jgi:DNA invertase Pin-like site-specific DNA recombinase